MQKEILSFRTSFIGEESVVQRKKQIPPFDFAQGKLKPLRFSE
jgi:hypothetical protein